MSEKIIILFIFLAFAAIEIVRGQFGDSKLKTRDDAIVESISLIVLLAITQPLVLFTSAWLAAVAVPEFHNSLSDISWYWGLTLFLIFDDMMQYWWHRASHNSRALYKLHRAHHNAQYMSVRIVYRNNVFFYLLMPGIWFSGILIYLGLGCVYASYLVVKLLVITGAHSAWRWDEKLYQSKWFHPIMWIIERVISTPSTHSAHHGRHIEDEATHYKGNYGNLLFLWDVLFGTAKITRKYPAKYGVEGLKTVTWQQQLFWPLKK